MGGQVNGRQSFSLIAAHVAVALTVIVCATVLAGIGKISEEGLVTLYGAAIGLTGGAAGAIVATRIIPRGSTVVTPQTDQSLKTTVTTEKSENVPVDSPN